MEDNALNTVYRYHDATKHHPGRYARSLGFMDWSTQPYPFRRFEGAAEIALPIPAEADGPRWDSLFGGEISPAEASLESLSRFWYFSMALSAWKQAVSPDGDVLSRWALRVNPSSGNLHPTEAYVIGFSISGSAAPAGGPEAEAVPAEAASTPAATVHHYAPDEHVLEHRADLPDDWATGLELPNGAFLVGLTSIHWREAWKYGERAFRYCQHDIGHAVSALSLSAACLGWRAAVLQGPATAALGRILATGRREGPEREHPDLLMTISPGPWTEPEVFPVILPTAVHGVPNTLSSAHHPWPVIDAVAESSVWPGKSNIIEFAPGSIRRPIRDLQALAMIRQRRSAVAMDGRTSITRDQFWTLLSRLMPAANNPGLAAQTWSPQVSLAVFVHRVDGLSPGLYMLVRHPDHEGSLRAASRDEFTWETPEGCPEELPLCRLGAGDLRDVAAQLSCGQAIAGDGAFSLAMLARFNAALADGGPGMYPRLFWETGMIGQMLYLEAEAAGIQGTGIGCFFDDEVHAVLGLEDHTWQSLYHFTVGGAVTDARVQTAPAYLRD